MKRNLSSRFLEIGSTHSAGWNKWGEEGEQSVPAALACCLKSLKALPPEAASHIPPRIATETWVSVVILRGDSADVLRLHSRPGSAWGGESAKVHLAPHPTLLWRASFNMALCGVAPVGRKGTWEKYGVLEMVLPRCRVAPPSRDLQV